MQIQMHRLLVLSKLFCKAARGKENVFNFGDFFFQTNYNFTHFLFTFAVFVKQTFMANNKGKLEYNLGIGAILIHTGLF